MPKKFWAPGNYWPLNVSTLKVNNKRPEMLHLTVHTQNFKSRKNFVQDRRAHKCIGMGNEFSTHLTLYNLTFSIILSQYRKNWKHDHLNWFRSFWWKRIEVMQLHEIVLILKFQILVLVMAIYSQKNNQKKKTMSVRHIVYE